MKTKGDQKTCRQLVRPALNSRMEDIRKLWELWKKDSDASDDELGNWNEYGLCFDYVPAGTFRDQEEGYFRYQISYGGPSEEFRFFTDAQLHCFKVQFWYLDWNDGAFAYPNDSDKALLLEIFNDLKECGTVEAEFKKATE